jgi:hypothetical protein
MRRLVGKSLTVLTLATASLTLTSATASGSAPSDQNTKTLDLLVKTVDSAALDLGRPGPSLGDQSIFTSDLYQHGTKIGEGRSVCTITRIAGTGADAKVTAQCLGTDVLPAGQVTLQGAVAFTGPNVPPFTLAITGGTGAYKRAHGEADTRPINPTDAELTYRMIL